jgi:hypothetical protein
LTLADPQAEPRWETYADPLKLSGHSMLDLLAVRAKAPRPRDESDRRLWRRLRVAGRLWVPAEIRGPTGAASLVRVYPIDISCGGMSFFMGMFVHRDSECVITLQLSDDEMLSVAGRVVRCELTSGRAHEVAIRFDAPFDMALVQPPDAPAQMGAQQRDAASPAIKGVPPGISPTDPGADRAVIVEMKAMTEELAALVDKFAGRVQLLTQPH